MPELFTFFENIGHCFPHLHRVGKGLYCLLVQLVNAAIPHERTAPGQVHDGWGISPGQASIQAMAQAVLMVGKGRRLHVAGGAAGRIVDRQG